MMKKFLNSFVYAARGIATAIRDQQNLKIHLLVSIAVVAAGFYFDITNTEWCIVLLTIALVIALEMINSSLENITDLASPDYHPLAGKAKDIAAGAVLFAAVIAVIVGVLVFGKYLSGGS
jgi:diacylglycerol kinase